MVEYNTDDDGIVYTAYTYNGDGVRYSKETCAGPCLFTGYTWDIGVEAGLPLLLEDGEASYIYGPGGMILEEVTGGKEYYYHHDQLGSVRALTDGSGSEVNTYDYDAYGNKLPTSTGSTYNPFGYTGEYTDSESGMLYLRARYYDPATQQFLTRDPMLASTEQAYAYAAGTPTNAKDPTGKLFWFVVAGFFIGAAADVGVTLATNNFNISGQQAFASMARGGLGGGLTALAGPLGGTLARATFYSASSKGAEALMFTTTISAGAAFIGQTTYNIFDPCNAGNPMEAAIWGGGGGLTGSVIGSHLPLNGIPNFNTMKQATSNFGPHSLFSDNSRAILYGFAISNGMGQASNTPNSTSGGCAGWQTPRQYATDFCEADWGGRP